MKSLLSFFLIVLFHTVTLKVYSQPGIISTFAGNGTAASVGDGGSATSASLNHPIGIARDGFGNIYIAEYSGNRIRRVNPAGVISTVAGTGTAGFSGDGGPATAAKLDHPYWVDVDNSGNVYIADAFNNRIRKVDPAGVITTIAGSGIAGYSGDGGAATAAKLYTPTCVRIDNTGSIFLTDNSNHAIRKISPTGIITTIAGIGVAGFSGDGGPAIAARLRNPSSVWSDGSGNVYISDAENNRVRKIDASGTIATVAGNGGTGFSGDGGLATAAQIREPHEAVMDALGNLYLADNQNHRMRKVSPSGVISTVAGTTMGFSGDGGPATAAQIRFVNGICFGAGGAIYFADVFNHRIRVISGSTINNPPSFSLGETAEIKICANEMPIAFMLDTILSGTDLDLSQTLSWSIVTPPVFGSATVAHVGSSTGGAVVPTGLSYLPLSGYVGPDMFRVRISDGSQADTITINVTMETSPVPGVITGADTVCQGGSITLSGSAGGTWSVITGMTSVTSMGAVTGVMPGSDTVLLTVTNSCGTISTPHPVWVKAAADCAASVAEIRRRVVTVYPNPSNGDIFITIGNAASDHADVVIYNNLGQKVGLFQAKPGVETHLSLNLPEGVYLLMCNWEGETVTSRFIVGRG